MQQIDIRTSASIIYYDSAYHGVSDLTQHLGLGEANKPLSDLFCSPLPD